MSRIALVAAMFGCSVIGAQSQVIITTDPAGNPVVVQAGQLLTLLHEAGDLPNITARSWQLRDVDGALVPGISQTPDPIFDWVGHNDSNPLFLSAAEGPLVQIRIFEPGQYSIHLDAFGDSSPGTIDANQTPGFIEEGTTLFLMAPPGFNYQWKKDGAPITGETSESFTIDAVQSTDAGSYTVAYDNGLSGKAIVETPPFVLAPLPPGSLPALTPFALIVLGAALAIGLVRRSHRISH